MKRRSISLAILFLLSLFYACERSEEFDHIYLVDHSLVRSYTASNIINSLAIIENLYPEIATLADRIEKDVKIYSISYRTFFQGREVIASGLVSLPDEGGSYPMISFQNGTNTCHSNAPTADPNSLLYSLLNMNSGLGFIIAIPDYLGFGESEEILHPYHHTESSNQVIRDMIFAVEELSDYIEGVDVNKELYLMGYSQGGWATLAVLKDLENNLPGGYNLMAASCGAGAYDLLDLTHYILSLEEYPSPFYLPYYIESRRQNNIIDDPLDLFFKEPYATLIPGLFDGSLCNSELNSQFTTSIPDLLTENLLTGFDSSDDFIQLRSELDASVISPWEVKTPVLFAHSNGDENVPFSQSLKIYNDLLDAGTEESIIDFLELDGLLHNEAIIPWGIATLAWFTD
jgi:pimeloyl-ACP methyl ester carboxylesterase